MIARNSQNNEPVSNARGSVNMIQNGSNTKIATDAEFESDGTLFVSIGSNGPYSIDIQAEGFINHHLEFEVNCTSADCNPEKMVVMSPVLSPGETRIMMSWDELPADVDIHVMSIKKSDGSLCRTWYNHKTGCESISQDLDNTNGGFDGAETVTLLNNTVNMNYNYLIAIEDYEFEEEGKQFLNSGSGITITNGVKTIEVDMKAESIEHETEFYLFGCLEVDAEGFFTFKSAPDGTFFNGDNKESWRQMNSKFC